MFGFVVANVEALSQRDRERYQAVYCGLCHALGQHYGQLGRMTLTYDLTFLIILLSALDQTELVHSRRFRCPMHPLQKRTAFSNRHTAYAADMNLMLAYYQQLDDWQDEKKTAALMRARALGKHVPTLEARYPSQAAAIKEGLARLSELEGAGEINPDLPAAAFGGILAQVFAPQGHPLKQELASLGDKLGRFIYLMDAAVDLKKDIKKERYNPLVTIPTHRHEQLLRFVMADCTEAFDALPILRDRDLMENILYSGVWTRFLSRSQGEKQA